MTYPTILNRLKRGVISALMIGALGASSLAHAAEDKFITIGTGGITGVYYPAGGAICRLVKRGRREHNIRCTVESTGGSIYNVNAIRQGELDLGVVQSDWQYHAVKGSSDFEKFGPFEKLRSLFSLHSEPFTVVARKDSGIEKLADLKGKRVNVGNPGSGSFATMEVVMDALGWTLDDFKLASRLKASEQGQALCDNKIDAFVYAAGHPNGLIQETTTTCEAVLIDVKGPEISKLVEKAPFYSYATIPGGMYTGTDEDVKSFGVKATFVSSADVDADVIYEVVKAVFENFDNFKTLHPVFATITKEDMVHEANSAPLHEGARRYYEEVGLLKDASVE